MNDIFISYRRSDSADITGRIRDHLTNEFGADRLFRDVDKIPLGQDFGKVISDAIDRCTVLLVIIGDNWLSVTDEAGRRRIDDPEDYVQMEVRLALERGRVVIPVLVENAEMPAAADLPPAVSSLSTINGTKVRADPDFPTDIKRLCASLPVSVTPVRDGRARSVRAWGVACAVVVLVACVFGLQEWWPPSDGTGKPDTRLHSSPETVGPQGVPNAGESESAAFAKMHPAFLVHSDKPTNYESTVWSTNFSQNALHIEAGCRSTGRIDLPNHPSLPWAGTGWVLEKASVVVPKYVLETFARKDESGWRIEREALIDFGKYGSEYHSYRIESVKYVGNYDNHQGLAVLEVPTLDSKFHVPLIVETEKSVAVREGRKVFIVGFPAQDPRAATISTHFQNAVLKGIYDVKRVMPGALTGQRYGDADWLVRHDCFTTAGTGGAPLFDLATGRVIAVQVARDSPDFAYGVGMWILDEYLKK